MRAPWLGVVIASTLLVVSCSPSSDADTTTTAPLADLEPVAESVVSPETDPPSSTTSTTSVSPSSSSTTTTAVSATSTTTTNGSSASTTTMPTTTTVPPPDDNEPPAIEIISPLPLASYTAAYDSGHKTWGANVALSAVVSDPNGDKVTVTWSSSTQGGLGTGESIIAFLSTGGYDASQPVITATATDVWGVATTESVQVIVWIPSDT